LIKTSKSRKQPTSKHLKEQAKYTKTGRHLADILVLFTFISFFKGRCTNFPELLDYFFLI